MSRFQTATIGRRLPTGWIVWGTVALASIGGATAGHYHLESAGFAGGSGWVGSAHVQALVAIEPSGFDTATGGWFYGMDFGFAPVAGLNEVTGRFVFYNQSVWDGGDAIADARDDAAIATDKRALRPGETATFANYTSYSRGLNGIMVDLPPGAAAFHADFRLRTGNSDDPSGWAPVAVPPVIDVRPGAGVAGADRITLVWEEADAVRKKWLEVTVLPGANTGLAAPDTFYFGNAVGDTGNNPANAQVDLADQIGARNNPRNFLNPAPSNDRYDFDRNRRVDLADEILARNNGTTFLTALRLIHLGSSGATAALAGAHAAEPTMGSVLLVPVSVQLDGGELRLEGTLPVTGIPRLETTLDPVLGPWTVVARGAEFQMGPSTFRWSMKPDSRDPARFFRVVLEQEDFPGTR